MYGIGCASTVLGGGGGEHAAWGQVWVQLVTWGVTGKGQVRGEMGRPGVTCRERGAVGRRGLGSMRGLRRSARVPHASCPDGHRRPVHT